MKLAYIVSLFPKLSETFILRELLELRQRGHEVTIVSLKSDREALEPPEAAELAGATIYPTYGWSTLAASIHYALHKPAALMGILARVIAGHLGHPGLLVRSLALVPLSLQVARQLRARRIEHVHAHWATYPALSAWIVSRLTGISYSVTGHAHDLYLPNPMLPVKLRDSAFFATISEFNRALLLQRCGGIALEKVRLIRCGIPLDRFTYAAERPSGDPPLLVSVGRLVDYKGFDVLIRACSRLRGAGTAFRCVIVGEGPERGRLDELIRRLGLAGEVSLEGGRRQADVAALMSRADLFVLACVPGREGIHDGIPVVLMEAMALGVPVISTRLSGIPELVVDNKTGLLVAPGDDQHLAAAIVRLLQEPERAGELRAGGRRMIEAEFDLQSCVRRLAAELQRAPSRMKGKSR